MLDEAIYFYESKGGVIGIFYKLYQSLVKFEQKESLLADDLLAKIPVGGYVALEMIEIDRSPDFG